jgi:hypothetical protein
MNWIYSKKEIKELSDIPEGCIGFVYIITRPDGSYYVGKKSIYSTVKLKPLKGERKKRIVTKESNWKVYMSSNKDVQKWVDVEKEILHWCYSKIELTYYENKALYCLGVLEDNNSMNGNISGKIYKESILKK